MSTILLRINIRIQIKNMYIHCTLKKTSDQSELSPLPKTVQSWEKKKFDYILPLNVMHLMVRFKK